MALVCNFPLSIRSLNSVRALVPEGGEQGLKWRSTILTHSMEAGWVIGLVSRPPAAASHEACSLSDTIVTTVILVLIRHVALNPQHTYNNNINKAVV